MAFQCNPLSEYPLADYKTCFVDNLYVGSLRWMCNGMSVGSNIGNKIIA